jgi:microcystin degradation protein MlrC
MKLFVACLNTETNTFSSFPTSYRSFAEVGYLVHKGRHDDSMKDASAPVFTCRWLAEAQGWQVVESLCAIAVPGGITVRSVYEDFRQEILDDLKAALPINMIFLDLHGAMIAEGYDDCEGDLLAHIRSIVGPAIPIGATLDPHCHLTKAMVENTTVLVMAKEYPHTDFIDRTQEALSILATAAQGKVQPHMSVFDCRMIVAALHTTHEPGRSFVDHMMKMERQDGRVLSVSLCHGMPWGDVPEMGAKVLVVTDNQPELGATLAEALGQRLFDLRHTLSPHLLSVDETLDRVLEILRGHPARPVVVADFTDNPGGGAPGDATFILRALLDRGIESAVFATIWDPAAVTIASDAGEGAHLNLRIGGKTGPSSGLPVDVRAHVSKVAKDSLQTFAGNPITIGNAAVIQTNGVDIILNSQRTQIFGVDCITNLGIDAIQKSVIVVKSSQHFYVSFGPIAAEVIYCAAPGTLMMDIPSIPYQRTGRNKWPLVDDPFAS